MLLAEVPAGSVRVRLYRVAGAYRLRFAGWGWHPQAMRTEAEGWRRLLACQSYGPCELELVRPACRAEP